MKEDPNIYPPGLDRDKVEAIIAYYDNQTEDEAVAEDEAAWQAEGMTMMQVPTDLVPLVRDLIAQRRAAG
jgi:L-alanine-DL-glutamate epimerase-like enolase superfamily enzyme